MRKRPPTWFSALLAALLLAGCSGPDGSSPGGRVEDSAATSSVAAGAPAAITPESVFAGLDAYWTTAYPAAFGVPFEPLRGAEQPLDSGATTGSALCISSPGQLSGNAYYCPEQDGIVYDTGVLVPVLIDHYGAVGLLTSLAHEYGHAVAARMGVAAGPPMTRELQADCLAGAFLSWAVSSDGPFGLTAADVGPAVAPLLDFGDQIGVAPTDATAHGLAIDRAQALRLGYLNGPGGCSDLTASTISVALDRFPVVPSDGPRFDSDAAVIDAAVASVHATVDPALPRVVPPDADVVAAAAYGQFALGTVAVLAGASAAGQPAAAAGCLAGRWTDAVFGAAGADQLGGRLSDPDEALNVVRTRPGGTTEELFGFVDGFAGRC